MQLENAVKNAAQTQNKYDAIGQRKVETQPSRLNYYYFEHQEF